MRRVIIRWAALCLVAGCSGDGSDAEIDAADAGTDAADAGDSSPSACDGVPIATGVGASCGGTVACSEGAQCASVVGSAEGSRCLQLCVPGACETVCADDERCAPLTASPGSGVCAATPVGDAGAYTPCAPEEPCAAGLTCVSAIAGGSTSVCLPPCVDGACAPVDGRGGQCVVSVGSDQLCAPECTTVDSAQDCPNGMVCRASGEGAVCVF